MSTMAVPPKVVALQARPLQVSILCFEIGGILDEVPAQLGAVASEVDLANIYATLRASPTVSGDPSRLLYDSAALESFAKPLTLAALRAEPAKALLDQAIDRRQNAFFAKYANGAAIIAQMNTAYSPAAPGSKPNRLATLRSLAADQAFSLRAAYANDQRIGVVKGAQSALDGTTTSSGASSTGGRSTTIGQSNRAIIEGVSGPGEERLLGVPPEGEPFSPSDAVEVGDKERRGEEEEGTSGEWSETFQTSTNSGSASEQQTIVNQDTAYRTPFFESQAQHERAQISLIDEQFAQFMYSQNLPNLDRVFTNELRSIDADVRRLQVAVLNTILLSPIAGVVTGIYKNSGDWVSAGEPVVRVENNDVVLLVGVLIYRGPISNGMKVTVATDLFDAGNQPARIAGTVVAARGRGDDDRWEVVVQCPNLDDGGQPILPLGYEFDYDDTAISIS